MTAAAEDIIFLTRELRENQEPLWSRLRDLVRDRGLEPSSLALIEFFPEDQCFISGFIAAADGRVFGFGFDYLHAPQSHGKLVEWHEFSTGQTPHPCTSAGIKIGVKIAQGNASAL
jgi:hypothetical protein